MTIHIFLNNRIVSLIEHPGLTYPKNILETRIGPKSPSSTMDKDAKLGEDGITTHDASLLLKTSMSGARQLLRRKGIPFVLIKSERGSMTCYWNKARFLQLFEHRPSICKSIPNGWLTSKDTCMYLGVNRSALYRLTIGGLLIERKAMLRTRRGVRTKSFYSLESIERTMSTLEKRRRRAMAQDAARDEKQK